MVDRANPCRFYNVPHKHVFGCIAATNLHKGECVVMYYGKLREAEECANEDPVKQWYSFSIGRDDLPKSYLGPELIIENLTCGNEARFINDPCVSVR